MIFLIFIIGFILGLIYTFIADKLPLLLPEVTTSVENSWILNLFLGVTNGLILLISYYSYGLSYEFFTSLIISALVIIIFLTDFKYMIILDSPLIIFSFLMIILKIYYFDLKTLGLSILSGIILFIFMLFIALIGKKIFKKDALGGGDIKLSFLIGLILNLRLGLLAIIFSSLLALPYSIATILLNKEREVPFGPFLVGSLALVFIFSAKFLNLINFLIS